MADQFTNPVLANQPAISRDLHFADKDSNPATLGRSGSTVAPNPTGVVQTTIDTKTTTIHPDASINNPVKPDGSPASLKKATLGQATAQASKAVAPTPSTPTPPATPNTGAPAPAGAPVAPTAPAQAPAPGQPVKK